MSRPSNKAYRHRQIIAELAASPTVRISELAGAFGVSAETVRRDIDELTRRGLVDRTYGGASTRHIGFQPAFGERDRLAVAERAAIARSAARLVKPGDVVMIDSGSTTTQFARALAAQGSAITVITNSFGVATALVDVAAIRVVLCPGDFSARERGVYGPETIAFLERFYADLAVIGASGLVAEGPTDVESKACWVKRTMIARAPRRALLVDASKFGRRHLELVCPIRELTDLVTDRAPAAGIGKALRAAGTAIHLADAASPSPASGK